jgi:nucleotide-binding universal stress UspA family protein
MKEIIVGIDFSKSSIQAMQYALKLAEICQCNMKLIYVCKTRDKESKLIKDERGMGTSIVDNFEKLIAENEKFSKLISYKILEGKIWEEISNQAKYTDAELIITGAHGMSGFEELWVGNNALKILSHSEKPVLCVKKNFKIKKPVIEKIVLPIDHTKGTLQKIPFILQLASSFKAQINVLSIYNSKQKQIEENVEKHTRLAMESIINSGLRYINEKKISDNPAKSTIEYAVKRNADLIAVMTENETGQSVFLGTIPQQIINQSPIPVISFKSGVVTSYAIKSELVVA